MFAIKAPQTITLTVPGEDEPDATINFKINDADSSRCVMEVLYPEGQVHRLVFNTRGTLVDSSYTAPDKDDEMSEEERRTEASPTSHMVDGRDMRAFNPYTYEAPVTDDQKSREGLTPGFTQPPVANAEMREQAEKDRQEAADRAKEQIEALKTQSNESAEERTERQRNEENKAFDNQLAKQDASVGDDSGTTNNTATAKTFPSQETQGLVQGKKMDGSPINEATVQNDPDKPGYNPMAPAPSSPQPGSPPPHPLDQPDVGRVTTLSDISGEPAGTTAEQQRVAEQDKVASEEQANKDAAKAQAEQDKANRREPA